MTGGERGSALVTAVIGVAVFAYLALEMLDNSRASVALIQAQSDRAHLAAAVDAGVAMTIHALGLADPAQRLQADGRVHASYFDGVNLAVSVQDEQGKIAINKASPDIERRLFAAAGIEGPRLDVLVDSLEDWKDYDDMVRPNGAELDYYAAMGIMPRDDDIRTLEEISHLRGMDTALLSRIAPAVTLSVDWPGGFDASAASPLALAAMSDGANAFDIQKRLGVLAGQRPALEITDGGNVMGHMFSMTVDARLPDGARLSRTMEVQFTGDTMNPYWIRYVR